ncbi:uncharacterized protein MEPE_05118 [Melanopsichium pennsylvanicum]|uniref:Uncharacterized protein n=1 Tax=Melanopsichium pennsylvanicum TaxID=63383 RepID=A0AAJ4XNW4_9BASI|nr:uncharacterized protein MEPE_05118 [Melanopsichium pennsylvanicum]
MLDVTADGVKKMAKKLQRRQQGRVGMVQIAMQGFQVGIEVDEMQHKPTCEEEESYRQNWLEFDRQDTSEPVSTSQNKRHATGRLSDRPIVSP